MNKFQIGDRVRCHYFGSIQELKFYDGVITGIGGNGLLFFEKGLTFHPKWCRKLIPKKPRRRVWLDLQSIWSAPNHGCGYHAFDKKPEEESRYVEFVQVIKRSKNDRIYFR